MEVFESLKANLVGKNARIVLPEGEEPRILQATKRLVKETEVIPVLLGNPEKIKIYLEIEGIMDGYEVIDPQHYPQFEEMVAALVERRKGKMSEEDARKILVEDVNYFGVMLVYLGLVDGMVSGAIHSTASTVRPALQIIKTRPNVTRTSGAFLMVRGTERYLFGDCAININPDAEALAEIAINSAITAKMFGIEPKIAMLSYSTKGSGFGESVDKVVEATKIAHDLRPDLEIDGELQFDAAFVPETAALKAPGSTVAGQANVFIFPGIEAGNIGYKMAERLGAEQQNSSLKAQQQMLQRLLSVFCGMEVNHLQKPKPAEVSTTTNNRPELSMFDSQIKLVEAKEKALNARLMPKLGLFAQGYYGYPGYNIFEDMMDRKWTLNGIVGIKMSWDLSAFYTHKNDRERLNMERKMAENAREVFLFNSRLDEIQHTEDVDRYQKMVQADEEIITLRTNVRKAAESKLAHGIIDVNSLLREINNENAAKAQQAIHEIDMLKEMYNLKYTNNE